MIEDTQDSEWVQYVIKNGRREVPPSQVAWDIINPRDNFDGSGVSRRNFLGGDKGYVVRFEPELRAIAQALMYSSDWEGRRNGKTLDKRINELKKLKPYVVNDGQSVLSDHSEVIEMWRREDVKYASRRKAFFYGKVVAASAAIVLGGFLGYKYCLKPLSEGLTGAAQGIERLEKRDDLSKYGLPESNNDSETMQQ
jgi:hypothetical protein